MDDIKLYRGDVYSKETRGGSRIAIRICGPAEGVTVIRNEGADSPPLHPSIPPVPFALSSHYLALTLLRGNLLINSQLVSAARRLINTRRVARWRHAQNSPLDTESARLCVLPLKICQPTRRHYRPGRLLFKQFLCVGWSGGTTVPKSFAKAFYASMLTGVEMDRDLSKKRWLLMQVLWISCIPSVEIKSNLGFIMYVRKWFISPILSIY